MGLCIYRERKRGEEKEGRVREIEGVEPGTTELGELAAAREDDESYISIAQKRKLESLLEQTIPSLRECHLTVDLVLDPLQHDLTSPHPLSLSLQKKKP